MPDSFPPVFAACALALCLLGWLAHRIWPDHFPRDKQPAHEIFTDILLAVPRTTLAVWGNQSWRGKTEPGRSLA